LTFPGVAGFDWDDSDDGSSSVEFRLQGAECPPRRGRSGGAHPVIHLCILLLHRDGVLFSLPSNTAVVGIGHTASNRQKSMVRARTYRRGGCGPFGPAPGAVWGSRLESKLSQIALQSVADKWLSRRRLVLEASFGAKAGKSCIPSERLTLNYALFRRVVSELW
jgi:hypothetical protein